MTVPLVVVIDYGAGNVRSVVGAFRRIGVEASSTADPELAARADLCVLPGVGSAGSAMATLKSSGLDQAISTRVQAGAATLGICLGLHLALEGSDEDGGVAGLGLLSGRAVRLEDRRVPRMGWSVVGPGGDAMYFAHSYAAVTDAAVCHSEGIVAEARHGSFVGVQYHPEKSGPAGERFLRQCLSRA